MTTLETRGSSGQFLCLVTDLPVAFHADVGARRTSAGVDKLANLRVLQAYDVLEEHAYLERIDGDNLLTHELRRLDTKVSLLLTLIGEMLRDQRQPPATCAVRLDREGVECRLPTTIAPGSMGYLELFVHPSIPLPLRWRVSAAAASESGMQRFSFDALSEAEVDQLERLIFLAHRQTIADERRADRP